ncbi:sialin-like [Bombyx mandarina]|uniref:Sialin-like n=1 Tax=Bombyx mandarina TaxID=7092 RepID=A0A6J2JUA7_BOMMA|nr:sialin-like [Bombyx mandarina]
MQPSMVQVLRHWVPPTERNNFLWAHCGVTTGTCFTFLMCAAIQYYSRWPVGFYIVGGLQVLWAMLWMLLVTNNPRNHWCITNEELEYLTNTIGNIFTIKLSNSHTPWKLILKSVPFWALCILNFGYSWNITALCIHGPLYYSEVLKYNIYKAAALTALPFFLRLVFGATTIQCFYRYKLTDYYKKRKHLRKYFIVLCK